MLKSALSSKKNPKNEQYYDNFAELKIGFKKKGNCKSLKTAFRFIVHRVLSKIICYK